MILHVFAANVPALTLPGDVIGTQFPSPSFASEFPELNETKLYLNLNYWVFLPFLSDNDETIGSQKVITTINFMLVPEVLNQPNFQFINQV